ncbi:hypothetical protein F7725_006840 [Dissostichus mawsoni]|uniref:Uncharacterized protein n=1 Tax=Dissostichus mawsoni TaxID=36200 RepID=A0A7J5XXZ6_DISMA|nr:hypothetical protein F7725_006840 [Dissostichus mawsoni]
MPSQMVCEVTMVVPTKAVTRHVGIMQLMMTPAQPRRHKALASICIPVEAMTSRWREESSQTLEKCTISAVRPASSSFNATPDLNVGLAAVLRASLGVLHIVVLLNSGGTGAAEEPPAQDQQPCGGPAEVQRGPQLPPLSVGHDGVVEITNDGVGSPADGDQHHDACDDKDDS